MKSKHPVLYTILFLLLYIVCPAQQTTISLTNNLHITKSVKVEKGTYQLRGIDSLNTGTIVIEGNNITVDFNGAIISGSNDIEHPDKFKGLAILIQGGKNITLKNAVIKGFKVAVMGRQTSNLKISNCDFSYNFRQHLNSNREREDVTDWQSYHHNEKDEWLRFGAGIYLRNCDSAIINNNVITNGQCALMMTNCNNGQVYNNNFSFNPGIGIGMYKSSRNHIINNKVDWNVRGFSWSVYNRGQDSAGILVYEQSSNNVFAHNSVTHSGDGFFLWAGQTTMDNGTGGCNDNLVYGNNFSYAPTNGIEITFSRNRIIKNIVNDCWHGLWGGFSYNTVIAKNYFSGNESAIAIEHGQDNSIKQNTFQGDTTGIQLWFTPNRKGEPGYMNSKDTRSRDYRISNNTFMGVKTVFDIKRSENILVENNKATGYKTLLKTDTTVKNLVVKNESGLINTEDDSIYIASVLPKDKLMNAMLPEQHLKGKKYIMMTEWGPYNFSYPILWLTKTDSTGKMFFDVIGDTGSWKIKKMQGVSEPSVTNGWTPGQVTFQKNNNSIKDINIEMEYKGAAIISPFGERYKAGTAYDFSYKEFDVPMTWKVNWYAFDSASNPLKQPAAFQRLLNSTPIKTAETKKLDYVWWNGLGKGFPDSNLATVSAANVTIPKGMYRLSVSAGDMVKVFVDDKLVIDAWDISKKVQDADYHSDASIVLGGKHTIRIEQAQFGGYGMLIFKLQKQ